MEKNYVKTIKRIVLFISACAAASAGGWWYCWAVFCLVGFSVALFVERAERKPELNICKELRGVEYNYNPKLADKEALGLAFITGMGGLSFLGGMFAPRIYVGSRFMKLTEDTQVFVLQHELGHISASTPDTDTGRFLCVIKGGVSKAELEADAFAARIVGTEIAVAALRELRRTLWYLPDTYVELSRRIAAVKRL